MAALSSSCEYLSVTCGAKTFILNLDDNCLTQIDHSTILQEINAKSGVITSSPGDNKEDGGSKTLNPDSEDLGLCLSTSDISAKGNLLAFCTHSKYLCIANLEQKVPVVSKLYELKRGASKIKFTPETQDIVVADKSGDVYMYRIKKEGNTGELVLGHLSLLLDFLITSDEKVIITCDRDEKIRISSFPNGYNIIAYCLGHMEFVSSLGFMPHKNSYIFSTSGDSTLRFWDFKVGSELLVCNVLSHVSADSPCNTNNDGVAVITDSDSILINDSTSLVCLCVQNLKMCVTLKCFSVENKLQYSICQYIPFTDISPWRVNISKNLLWIASHSSENALVKTMILNKGKCCFEEISSISKVSVSVEILNSHNMSTGLKNNVVDLLYKKKFDNVREYLRKKEAKHTVASLEEPRIKKIKH